MATGNLAYVADTPLNVRFGRSDQRVTVECEMAEQRRTIFLLRDALTQAKELLLQKDELLQHQQAILDKLLASQEEAAVLIAGLTPRQHQIMELVVAGQLSKNIAADLGVSQRTIENHRASIMKKTSANSLPALARIAFVAACADGLFAQHEFPPRR
jgi:DNA-binding NarL/FixJ family response regulator